MKIGKFRLAMATVALAAAVCLAFLIGVLRPEAGPALIGAAVVMGLLRVIQALYKHRARVRIAPTRPDAGFLPAGGEIA